MPSKDINDVLKTHEASIMAVAGVVGIYVSALDDGTPCLKIMVEDEDAERIRELPKTLDGHPVVIVETGEIRGMESE